MPKKNKVEFRLSVFLACIVFDIVDYAVDFIQSAGGDVPVLGVLVDFFGGTVDIVAATIGLLFFMKMKAGVVISSVAIIDPLITEGLPLYTLAYLMAVWFDIDAAKIKNSIGA